MTTARGSADSADSAATHAPGEDAMTFGLSGPVALGGEGLGDAAQVGARAVQFADAVEGGLLLVSAILEPARPLGARGA